MSKIKDSIKDEIIKWLQLNAYGRENAKPRHLLREFINQKFLINLSDRTLRRIYAEINQVGYACSKPAGIFWISDSSELQTFKAEQKAKVISIFARTKRTVSAIEKRRQLELFSQF